MNYRWNVVIYSNLLQLWVTQPNYQGSRAEKGASNQTNAEGNYICRDAGDRRVGRKAPARIGG